MGYFFTFISLLAGSTKGFIGKKISDKITTERQSALVSTVRMVMCILISLLAVIPELISGELVFDGAAVLWGSFAGFTIAIFVVSWMLAVKHGAYTLVSVAQMFGSVVAVILSLIVFRTPITIKQILAIAILCLSVFFMLSYNKGVKGKMTLVGMILLVVCGLSGGLNDFGIKLFTAFSEASVATLNLVTYIVASLTLLIFLLITMPKKAQAKCEDEVTSKCPDSASKEIEERPTGENLRALLCSTLIPVGLMAVCMYLQDYFKALANVLVPPVQLFPIFRAGGLILSATMSALFFKEKITVRCVIGLVLAFVAIMLLK